MAGCPKGSLDDMELLDLMKKSRINKECMDEARKVFKMHFSNNIFAAQGPMVDDKQAVFYETTYKVIYLQNMDVIEYLLNNFGDLISKFEVSFDSIHMTNGRKIIKYINSNSSKTLETLLLEGCKGNVLNDLSKQFTYVYQLSFASSSTNKQFVKLKNPKLYELFRELYFLSLNCKWTDDWILFNGNFPKLRKLHVRMPHEKQQNNVHTSHFIRFLNKNPQIEMLTIENTNVRILSEVNAVLKQLDNLNLNSLSQNYDNFDCEPIEFKTVQYLTIESMDGDKVPHKIAFNQVQSVGLTIEQQFDEKWIDFLVMISNQQLQKFVIDTEELPNEALWQIPNLLFSMNNFYVSCKSTYTADDVIEFLKRGQLLREVDLHVFMDEADQERLKQTLSADWIVSCRSYPDNTVIIRLRHKEYGKRFILLF